MIKLSCFVSQKLLNYGAPSVMDQEPRDVRNSIRSSFRYYNTALATRRNNLSCNPPCSRSQVSCWCSFPSTFSSPKPKFLLISPHGMKIRHVRNGHCLILSGDASPLPLYVLGRLYTRTLLLEKARSSEHCDV